MPIVNVKFEQPCLKPCQSKTIKSRDHGGLGMFSDFLNLSDSSEDMFIHNDNHRN